MLNFKQLVTAIQEGSVNTQARDESVQAIIALAPKSKAQVFAMIAHAAQEQGAVVPTAGTPWADLSQDQKDIVTIYSQVSRKLGFIA